MSSVLVTNLHVSSWDSRGLMFAHADPFCFWVRFCICSNALNPAGKCPSLWNTLVSNSQQHLCQAENALPSWNHEACLQRKISLCFRVCLGTHGWFFFFFPLPLPPPLWLAHPVFWPSQVPLPVLENYEGHMLPSLHISWPHCKRWYLKTKCVCIYLSSQQRMAPLAAPGIFMPRLRAECS